MTCAGPTAIRFPRGSGAKPDVQLAHEPFAIGQAERVADGDDGCIIAYGPGVYAALEGRRRIHAGSGRALTVVNARFAKPLDEAMIAARLAPAPGGVPPEDPGPAGG